MKKNRRNSIQWCLSATPSLLLSLIASIGLVAGAERGCILQSFTGEVKAQRSGSTTWSNARVNMPLREKDELRTFVESDAVLQIADGSILKLGENTTFTLSLNDQETNGKTSTSVKLLSGELIANVKKMTNPQSKFEMETPTALAAIRGTVVGLLVDKSSTSIKVYEGRVMVTPKGARRGVELVSNQMTTVKKGQTRVTIQEFKEKPPLDSLLMNYKPPEAVPDSVRQDTTSGMMRGDTTAREGSVKGLLDTLVSAKSSVAVDSVKVPIHRDTLPTAPVRQNASASAAPIVLRLQEPVDGFVISKPLIKIAGIVSPPTTEISCAGMTIPVSPTGFFTKEIPVPDEEGPLTIEIEASNGTQTIKQTRTVQFKKSEEIITITVQAPLDKAILCDRKVAVKGIVSPSSVEAISVQGIDFPVRGSSFEGFVLLPAEQGSHVIEFDVTRNGKSAKTQRTVVYDPAGKQCNSDAPVIQPGYFPLQTKTSPLNFTVYDKTPADELTVYTSIDGSSESEPVTSGAQIRLALEEGIHRYELYCGDKAGNSSMKLSGTIQYLARDLAIQVVDPRADYTVVHVPPSTPSTTMASLYTIKFMVRNLPEDNTNLLKEIRIVNALQGGTTIIKNFNADINFETDVTLKRGKNQITIDVRDCNDRVYSKNFTIDLR